MLRMFFWEGEERVGMDIINSELSSWLGIVFCISQSAIFSGLNLAFFSITRLRLEVEVSAGNKKAAKVLEKRKDSNFLLTTILWGNVGINVLLTLLSDSVMAGVSAFLFSTIVITFLGEIIPQAYFSRHALRMAYFLSPVITFYQFLLYPVAKPIALGLDYFLGKEGIIYFREHNLREIIKKHIEADDSEIDRIEGIGALNFLEIDDLNVSVEGEIIDPRSIIELSTENGKVIFPEYENLSSDPFIQKINLSKKKWVVFTDNLDNPQFALDADGFLRAALLEPENTDILSYCHTPLVVRDLKLPLGKVIVQLQSPQTHHGSEVIDKDIVLVWSGQKKVITGADILGRLLMGIKPEELS